MLSIKSMFRVFIYVIAGNTIGAAIFISLVLKDQQIPTVTLWQFIILAAFCALGNLIYYSEKELNRHKAMIRQVFHYIYINISILGAAGIWDWMKVGMNRNTIILIIIIAFVYAGIISLIFIQDTKTAEDVNEILKNINKEEPKE